MEIATPLRARHLELALFQPAEDGSDPRRAAGCQQSAHQLAFAQQAQHSPQAQAGAVDGPIRLRGGLAAPDQYPFQDNPCPGYLSHPPGF